MEVSMLRTLESLHKQIIKCKQASCITTSMKS